MTPQTMFAFGREPVPLFVEPCAGALGVSMALAGSRAPCGWMGGKMGYADAILQTMGLRRGQGVRELWIADTNDWAKAWPVLLSGQAKACAEVIRGWQGTPAEEARRWRELRDVWRAEGTPGTVEGAARWVALVGLSAMMKGPQAGCARAEDGGRTRDRRLTTTAAPTAKLPTIPTQAWPDAREIPTPPAGSYVLIDPPYDGTTGYGGGLPRADVLALADRMASDGAKVWICEHDPLGPGAVDISALRWGTVRGKSRRTSEWLTPWG
jgi:hypothetical protein